MRAPTQRYVGDKKNLYPQITQITQIFLALIDWPLTRLACRGYCADTPRRRHAHTMVARGCSFAALWNLWSFSSESIFCAVEQSLNVAAMAPER
jgi:hypothetical protein